MDVLQKEKRKHPIMYNLKLMISNFFGMKFVFVTEMSVDED